MLQCGLQGGDLWLVVLLAGGGDGSERSVWTWSTAGLDRGGAARQLAGVAGLGVYGMERTTIRLVMSSEAAEVKQTKVDSEGDGVSRDRRF